MRMKSLPTILVLVLALALAPMLTSCGDTPEPGTTPSADAPAAADTADAADSALDGPTADAAPDAGTDRGTPGTSGTPGTPGNPSSMTADDATREDSLRSALRSLLAGPSAEQRAAGAFSWFSDTTANALRGVDVSGGRVVVDLDGDLDEMIPNASTSAGSEILLTQLDSVVFRFPWVEAVEYRMGGSCDAFWEWLQRGCDVVTR